MKLVNCEALIDFPNIVYMDISKNAIQDISVLQHITALSHLDARYCCIYMALSLIHFFIDTVVNTCY